MATKEVIRKNLKTSAKLLEFAMSTNYGVKNSMKVDLDDDLDGSGENMELVRVSLFIDCNTENGDMLEPNDVVFELKKMEQSIMEIVQNPVIQFKKDGSLGRVPENDYSNAMILGMKVDMEVFNVGWTVMVQL